MNATVLPSTGAATTGATGTTGAASTGFTSTTGVTTTGIAVNEADVNVDTSMSVEEVSGYYADTVADYYGSGVSVTVDKVESSSSSYGSVSGSGVSKMKSSVSVVKGGGSKSELTLVCL